MVQPKSNGGVIPNDTRFLLSFTEFFLLSILLIYESVCFFTLVLLNLAIGDLLSIIVHKIHLPFNLDEATFQSILAISTFPMMAELWEKIEGLLIRPAINRAKVTYPHLLPNVPPFFSILLAIAAFWNIQHSFYERFNIFIEQSESPLQCFFAEIKYKICQMLPIKKDTYIYSLLKVDEDLLDEAENTNRFILSLLYLTFFLWKWVVKHTPEEAFEWSTHALTQLKANCLLGAFNIGITTVLSNIFDKYNVPIDSNMIIMGNAVGMALIAAFVPWGSVFEDGNDATGHGDEAERTGHASNSKWIHVLLFIISAAGLVFIFFKAEMIEDDDHSYETEFDSVSETLKEKLKAPVKYDSSRVIMFFKVFYGFQVLFALRSLTS